MALQPGTQLGAYRILGPLGAGGMGEVYRAHDERLGRSVAIKVLPDEFSRDEDRLRRFEQEGRATSALYVTSFPNPGRKWQVFSEGGMNPRCRNDGKEIYYLNQENAMAATEVTPRGDTLEGEASQRLFQTRAARTGKSYDISPDGQRFLINSAVDTSSSSPIVLVVNWTAGLKRN
jgi:serine/threonine protein kinase